MPTAEKSSNSGDARPPLDPPKTREEGELSSGDDDDVLHLFCLPATAEKKAILASIPMEGGSDGEIPMRNHENNNNSNSKFNNSSEGQSKPKRQMKTPFQLETLEKAYALETYPSESISAELSEKLGLSDRQLQMWFCHRRLKEKKEGSAGPAVDLEEQSIDVAGRQLTFFSGFGRIERRPSVAGVRALLRRRHSCVLTAPHRLFSLSL